MSNDYILKIKKAYAGHNCMQIMIPYDKNITIFDNSKILYHNAEFLQNFVNEYLNDKRRHEFPYSNIPTHKMKIDGYTFNSFNILFDYNKPYIVVREGLISEYMAIKNDDGASLIHKSLNKNSEKNYEMSREEIYNLLEESNNKEKIIIMNPSGAFVTDKDSIIPLNKGEIREKIINNAINLVNEYIDFSNNNGFCLRCICDNHIIPKLSELKNIMLCKDLDELINFSFVLDITKKFIDDETIIKSSTIITNSFDEILVAKINGKEIKLNLMELSCLGDDKYNVCIKNIPIDYNLDNLNNIKPKILKACEPKIDLKLNSWIKKDDIKQAKKLVKQRQKMIN